MKVMQILTNNNYSVQGTDKHMRKAVIKYTQKQLTFAQDDSVHNIFYKNKTSQANKANKRILETKIQETWPMSDTSWPTAALHFLTKCSHAITSDTTNNPKRNTGFLKKTSVICNYKCSLADCALRPGCSCNLHWTDHGLTGSTHYDAREKWRPKNSETFTSEIDLP